MPNLIALAREILPSTIGCRIYQAQAVVELRVNAARNTGPSTGFTGVGPTIEDALRDACTKIEAAETSR